MSYCNALDSWSIQMSHCNALDDWEYSDKSLQCIGRLEVFR